jgi:metal-responsive CopG/Arc/MetJ family transcriptional regulator
MTRLYSTGVKTAVSIPDPIFEAADRLARRRKVSRSQLYAEALTALLERERSVDVTARLDAVYADADSSLDDGLRSAQSAVLREPR